MMVVISCVLHTLDLRGSYEFREFLTNRSQQVIEFIACLLLLCQSTVLGPILFFLFINDLLSKIESTIKLIADDVLMFRGIYSSTDQQMLQKDIDNLVQWSDMWQMPFNLTKREHLRMAGRMLPNIYHYMTVTQFQQ